MSTCRTHHIYYSDLDPLILDCVHPLVWRWSETLTRVYWERHYLGGPHLRVWVEDGSPATVDRFGDELSAAVNAYLRAHPSRDVDYSAERAAALAVREGESFDEEDLPYRNNVELVRPSTASPVGYASPEARDLALDFRRDVLPIAACILEDARHRREQVLRLYFLQAVIVGHGDLPAGCVSYRSHWEGFSVSAPHSVVDRIHETYSRCRSEIHESMVEIQRAYEREEITNDPLLAAWAELIRRYAARAQKVLKEGKPLTESTTPGDVRRLRESTVQPHATDFIRTMLEDPRFVASLQFDHGFIVRRVLTNLLYLLLPLVDLTPLDRMALCHHAFRAAQDVSGRDLCDDLALRVAHVVARYGDRWNDAPAPPAAAGA